MSGNLEKNLGAVCNRNEVSVCNKMATALLKSRLAAAEWMADARLAAADYMHDARLYWALRLPREGVASLTQSVKLF